MPNPFGPECSHVSWHQGLQYCTWIADTQEEYDGLVAARQASAANQGQQFDGEPHQCDGVAAGDGYLVLLKDAD